MNSSKNIIYFRKDIVQTHSWREDNGPCKTEDLNEIVQEAITQPHRNSRRSYTIWLPLNEDTETKTAWQNLLDENQEDYASYIGEGDKDNQTFTNVKTTMVWVDGVHQGGWEETSKDGSDTWVEPAETEEEFWAPDHSHRRRYPSIILSCQAAARKAVDLGYYVAYNNCFMKPHWQPKYVEKFGHKFGSPCEFVIALHIGTKPKEFRNQDPKCLEYNKGIVVEDNTTQIKPMFTPGCIVQPYNY